MGGGTGLLKVSSAVIKIAAWIFLLMGLVASTFIMLRYTGQEIPRLMGPVVLIIYVLVFFFLHLVAGIADLLLKLSEQCKREGQNA
ncbi:MAG: hypothetical protein NTU54_08275 [Candidatus Omnitrophica bacterium]|nr:hypothetical protein [Candidatus Omnitrophota bacterium]